MDSDRIGVEPVWIEQNKDRYYMTLEESSQEIAAFSKERILRRLPQIYL